MTDVLILCYHAVSESWPASLSVTPAALEAQLGALVERGYKGATFSEAVAGSSTGRTLAVTFDDGYRSVIELAFPILARLELPGTVFVPTAFMGREVPMAWDGVDRWLGGTHERELVPLQLEQLHALNDAGWEIGSHTRSHPRLPRLGDAELAEELRGSKADLEQALGTPCRSLAYPYGAVDARVADAAAASGYVAAAGLAGYELRVHPLRWPRVNIDHADTPRRFSLKASRLARAARLARLRYEFSSRLSRS